MDPILPTDPSPAVLGDGLHRRADLPRLDPALADSYPGTDRRTDRRNQAFGRQAGQGPHQPGRREDPQPHAPRAALRLQGLRPLPHLPQGDHFRLGPHAAPSARLSAGGRVRPADGRASLDGRHRRRGRHHGGRARRGGPRALDGAEHPPALRAGGQPDHRRRSETGPHEVFLHPQADVRQGERRHLPAARRFRHAGRRPGGAHAVANRQARHGAGGDAGRAGRRLLGRAGDVHPRATSGEGHDQPRGPASSTGGPTASTRPSRRS